MVIESAEDIHKVARAVVAVMGRCKGISVAPSYRTVSRASMAPSCIGQCQRVSVAQSYRTMSRVQGISTTVL